MAQLLLQWMLSMPHFLTLIFKRHVYRLHYIFAIPYTECTANLNYSLWLGVTILKHHWQSVRSDLCQAQYLIPEMHWVCWVVSAWCCDTIKDAQFHTQTHPVSLTPSWNPLRKVAFSPRFLPPSIMSWASSFSLKGSTFTHFPSSYVNLLTDAQRLFLEVLFFLF